jgi:hypothetical protein
MSATDAPLTGDALLEAVTDAMVTLHERYHSRRPVTAKTLMLGDDLLACVMGGVYTDVEKTMIELQQTTIVQETRSAFQTAMQHKFIADVERLSGPVSERAVVVACRCPSCGRRRRSRRAPGSRRSSECAHAASTSTAWR